MRSVSRRCEIPFSFVFLDFASACGERPCRACSHYLRTHEFLLASGQLREAGYPPGYPLYLLFTNWVQGPYPEIQAQGFSYSPSLFGLFGKPRACISWYGTSTQLVNSLLHDPFLESE